MEDKIQHYRQPMVTVIGIFLGFLLNAAYNWVGHAFVSKRSKETVMAIGLCLCISLLLIVLYRILNMNYPKDQAEKYYRLTLHLFITGISAAFISIVIIMMESYFLNSGR